MSKEFTYEKKIVDKEFNDILKEKGPKMNKGRFRVRSASPRTVANFLAKLERFED